ESGLELSASDLHRVPKVAKLALDLFDRASAFVDATELHLELRAEAAGESFWSDRSGPVKNLVGGAEDGSKQVELPAQDVEGQSLGLVIASEKVDHRDVAPLAISMAAPDALLDTLRVPRQVVVDDGVAELEVEPLGARFGRDEH